MRNSAFLVVKMPWSQFNSSAKTQTPPLLYAEDRAKNSLAANSLQVCKIKNVYIRIKKQGQAFQALCVLGHGAH